MNKEDLQDLLLYLTLYMALLDHDDPTHAEARLFLNATVVHYDVAMRIKEAA